MTDARKAAMIMLIGALAGCSGPVFNKTPSPDGAYEASLFRRAGSMAPIYYFVGITESGLFSERCAAAMLTGERAQEYVRFDWIGPRALHVRYGLSPADRERLGVPRPVTTAGPQGPPCEGFAVTFAEDASLSGAAEQANRGRPHLRAEPVLGPDIEPANSSTGEP